MMMNNNTTAMTTSPINNRRAGFARSRSNMSTMSQQLLDIVDGTSGSFSDDDNDNSSSESSSGRQSDDENHLLDDGQCCSESSSYTATGRGNSHRHSHRNNSHRRHSNGNNKRSGGEADAEAEIRKLFEKESAAVQTWKEIVMGFLILTAVLVTVSVFIVMTRDEQKHFNEKFDDVASAIVESVQYEMALVSNSTAALADVLTATGLATMTDATTLEEMEEDNHRHVWPRVSVPAFDVHAQHVHTLNDNRLVWYSPLVAIGRGDLMNPLEERVEWEAYYTQAQLSLVSSPAVRRYPQIFHYHNRTVTLAPSPGPYAPVHQLLSTTMEKNQQQYMLPPEISSVENYNMMYEPAFARVAESMMKRTSTNSSTDRRRNPALSELLDLEIVRDAYHIDSTEPLSLWVQPVFSTFHDEDDVVVAFVQNVIQWKRLLLNTPEQEHVSVYAVVQNSCGQNFTLYFCGTNVTYLGAGDNHQDDAFENNRIETVLFDNNDSNNNGNSSAGCTYTMSLYPGAALRDATQTRAPKLYTAVIGCIFFLVAITFFAYDLFVKRRNDKVVKAAARSNAIVTKLFPSIVRHKLYKEEEEMHRKQKAEKSAASGQRAGFGLKAFMRDEKSYRDEENNVVNSKPMADLFPETTILFADLAGFTSWSSTREPCQVFTLLENLYQAFDMIARRRKIFKVETIGDCYVAVAGLPEPRADHAVAMAKFASDILRKSHLIFRQLEVELGPDTADLTMRVGLHSGPATAGVLRGERARFQLFGDTVNTASRMESNGVKGKIQISQETTDLLIAHGKKHWVIPRKDKIQAKGKGELQTYFLAINAANKRSRNGSSTIVGSDALTVSDIDPDEIEEQRGLMKSMDRTIGNSRGEGLAKHRDTKLDRLIDWNVEVLLKLLKEIVARREVTAAVDDGEENGDMDDNACDSTVTHPVKEVKNIISLPEFDGCAELKQRAPHDVEIGEDVVYQLRDYVTKVAALYNDNPFHNFEHASHVAMSVRKLLSRIVAPSEILEDSKRSEQNLFSKLHDHTYGITSDPLTQFACVFSALIHDTDHGGVPNAQLVKENTALAQHYENQSVAEQNSIDISWDLLESPKYEDLRDTICGTPAERVRFRQLVVNSVMATDIMDRDLKNLRNARWDRAFSNKQESGDGLDAEEEEEDPQDTINRKATIVIEHLIQASDVSHTMQHWHVYRKWNERFFVECYDAYKAGRADNDPSMNWYTGELGFFDFYIIPLAKKLKECGVFGVSSDEYLNYALTNRKEWEQRGEEVLSEMLEKVKPKKPAVEPVVVLEDNNNHNNAAPPKRSLNRRRSYFDRGSGGLQTEETTTTMTTVQGATDDEQSAVDADPEQLAPPKRKMNRRRSFLPNWSDKTTE